MEAWNQKSQRFKDMSHKETTKNTEELLCWYMLICFDNNMLLRHHVPLALALRLNPRQAEINRQNHRLAGLDDLTSQ